MARTARAQYKPIPDYVGIGAGQQFRSDVNNHLSGITPIAQRLVSLPFLQLPREQDGQLYWGTDCAVATPCQGGGKGAMAVGQAGAWVCGGYTPMTANLAANGNRVTDVASNQATGDALSQKQSHLNDLGSATAGYDMGGNKLQGLQPNSTTGDALSQGQSRLSDLATAVGPIVWATTSYRISVLRVLRATRSASDRPAANLTDSILTTASSPILSPAGGSGQAVVFGQNGAQLTTTSGTILVRVPLRT